MQANLDKVREEAEATSNVARLQYMDTYLVGEFMYLRFNSTTGDAAGQNRVEPEKLAYHYGVANVGSLLSGANNNGLQSGNAITAMFIATGQDVANVSESSAGIVYTELTPEKDLYLSLTIPSLIVATYGGGAGRGNLAGGRHFVI